jgi:hypothetical protein
MYAGSHFNYPENNCCQCGIEETSKTTVAPNTTLGCTNSEENKVSKPIIEYCNEKGISRLDCEDKQITFRGYNCQWKPCSLSDTVLLASPNNVNT